MVWQCSACHVAVSFLFLLLWWLASCFLSLLDLQSAHTLELFMFAQEKDGGGDVFWRMHVANIQTHTKKTFSDFFGVFLWLTKDVKSLCPTEDVKHRQQQRCHFWNLKLIWESKWRSRMNWTELCLQFHVMRQLNVQMQRIMQVPRWFFVLFIFSLQLMQVIKILMNKCSVINL